MTTLPTRPALAETVAHIAREYREAKGRMPHLAPFFPEPTEYPPILRNAPEETTPTPDDAADDLEYPPRRRKGDR